MSGNSFLQGTSWRSAAPGTSMLAWRQNSASRSSSSFQVGQFAILRQVPTWDVDSVVYSQLQHVNAAVAGHPLLVIGSKDNGRTVTCLQVTSFGNRSIEQKYPGNSEVQRLKKSEYVAIDHNNTLTHSGLHALRLANNETMKVQSYVHLDQLFTIEACYLDPWGNGKRLDAASIVGLEHAFVDFVSGVVPSRPSATIHSPLDYRPKDKLTMSWLGVYDHRFVKPIRRGCAIAIVKPPTPTAAIEVIGF